LKKDPFKIEVFHRADPFLQAFQKKIQDKELKPHLIFLNSRVREEDGLSMYIDLIQKQEEAAPLIYFCTTLSFGRFDDYFKNMGVKTPPYVSKAHIEKELDKIMAQYVPKDESSSLTEEGLSHIPLFKRRRIIEKLQEAFEEMKELHYGKEGMDKKLAECKKITDELECLAKEERIGELSHQMVKLRSILHMDKKVGVIRFRRETRKLMAWGEKFLKKIGR